MKNAALILFSFGILMSAVIAASSAGDEGKPPRPLILKKQTFTVQQTLNSANRSDTSFIG